jgi:hypothetical protein
MSLDDANGTDTDGPILPRDVGPQYTFGEGPGDYLSFEGTP